MSGRRSHSRFAVLQSPEGVLRVLQDVIVHNPVHDYTLAVGREPGILGQAVTVEFPMGDHPSIRARIMESQLVVVDGSIRHQLRLRHMNGTGNLGNAGPRGAAAE